MPIISIHPSHLRNYIHNNYQVYQIMLEKQRSKQSFGKINKQKWIIGEVETLGNLMLLGNRGLNRVE